MAAAPAAAVRIPFTNCLDDSYRFNDPLPLQWEPLYVDAVFDSRGDRHNLQVLVWGNVSGSVSDTTLPPPNDPYWQDDAETEGKIIQSPEPGSKNAKATTLFRKVDVLTFEPWSEAVDFCLHGLANASCPLGPVFASDSSAADPHALPSFNLSHDFFASYSFATFSPTLLVIWGDSAATNIGCVSATITPDLGPLAQLLRFLPLLVLALTGAAVVFAAVYSPWGSTDAFNWTANYGRDADLLRLVTPGFGDCLQYVQFVLLTGGLSLTYPGFYQPMVSRVSWSALMFNHSFVTGSEPWQAVTDGIYVTRGAGYGMTRLAQLVGMADPSDVWAGTMVWLCVIVLAVSVLIQAGFLVRWLSRTLSSTPEEDLRSKNLPFFVGNIVRVVYNYFLLPLVSLSAFQLAVASRSPPYTVALAVVTLVLLILFTAWALRLIIVTKPKAVLFDDLPILLRYGPLYNTYSDHSATFALIPIVLTFVRGIAIGAVQASGIAQVILLAICEVIQALTIHAFRPFSPQTSMNAYHTVFSVVRFITIILMVTFTPSLGITDGPRGWIGYAILILHAAVLILGFFINALQTIVEVVALMLGAGGDDDRGLTRGGLSKIFGMRQLSRRATPRNGPSRASQLSTAAMLDADDGSKTGYSMPGGRIRSESGASLGGLMVGPSNLRGGSSVDSPDLYAGQSGHGRGGSASSQVPGTPGGASSFSTPASAAGPLAASTPRALNQPPVPEAADPYYRPPRRRRETLGSESTLPPVQQQGAGAAGDGSRRLSLTPGGPQGDAADAAADISRGPTPAPPGVNPVSVLPNRPDYSTREVDFYYGVRGPALNSDGPGRKLGTGPADPTGPVATASGWFRSMFGAKTKEKGKGFEVVRSARMPPDMARNGGFGDETPPEGIPVAMGVLRNGPIESDDDEPRSKTSPRSAKVGGLLTETGEPTGPDDDEPDSPSGDALPGASLANGPGIPRKSSKRSSTHLEKRLGAVSPEDPRMGAAGERGGTPHLDRLPFERSGSLGRASLLSSATSDADPSQPPSSGHAGDERPTSYGVVSHHSINRVDPELSEVDLLGSSAEVIDRRATPGQ